VPQAFDNKIYAPWTISHMH